VLFALPDLVSNHFYLLFQNTDLNGLYQQVPLPFGGQWISANREYQQGTKGKEENEIRMFILLAPVL
jgi:hypothetical protein